jgi:small-conductance mechanosensitive channel
MQHPLDANIQQHIYNHEVYKQNAAQFQHAIQDAHSKGLNHPNFLQSLYAGRDQHANAANFHLQKLQELEWQKQQEQQSQTRFHRQMQTAQPRHFNGAHSDDSHATILQLQQAIARLENEINKLSQDIRALEQIIHNQYRSFQHLNSLIKNGEITEISINDAHTIEVAIHESEHLLEQMKKDVVKMHEENIFINRLLERSEIKV